MAELPLYLQISERLTRDIGAGLLTDGARLPPEAEMAAGLGVAVGTLRKALAELAARGLLVRRQGSGNYVRRPRHPAGIYAFFHLELPEGGGLPGAVNLALDAGLAAPDPGLAAPVRLRRLRTLDTRPAALEEIWIRGPLPEGDGGAEPAPLPGSLYRHYAEALGIWVARVEDRIGVGAVPAWTPPAFGLAPGAPCGLVERRATARDGRLAEISRTWFDPGAASYVARWNEESEA